MILLLAVISALRSRTPHCAVGLWTRVDLPDYLPEDFLLTKMRFLSRKRRVWACGVDFSETNDTVACWLRDFYSFFVDSVFWKGNRAAVGGYSSFLGGAGRKKAIQPS
mmetsp:Transcript_3583/g.7225  ORF Transcript_3583/g.7225 Transcript_3583/m.7225 type:complete len:108 (-) Transcript_3583:44-367(-)|eukprot:scaffold13066_cov145-Amphora_coffeaeformis.AAC.2